MPMRPSLSRKAISFSPSSLSRVGGASGFSSFGRQAGTQYSRISSPSGVPGPTRVRMSLCSIDSIRHSSSFSYGVRTLVRLYRDRGRTTTRLSHVVSRDERDLDADGELRLGLGLHLVDRHAIGELDQGHAARTVLVDGEDAELG